MSDDIILSSTTDEAFARPVFVKCLDWPRILFGFLGTGSKSAGDVGRTSRA